MGSKGSWKVSGQAPRQLFSCSKVQAGRTRTKQEFARDAFASYINVLPGGGGGGKCPTSQQDAQILVQYALLKPLFGCSLRYSDETPSDVPRQHSTVYPVKQNIDAMGLAYC